MRILLIEDTADVRMMLAAWLEDEGHDVIEADSLASAMAAFQPPHRYEAVIADVLLPDGSGQDLAELARQAGVPVLLCTGDINTLNNLQNQGFRCLSKPFRFEALAAWLADISLAVFHRPEQSIRSEDDRFIEMPRPAVRYRL